jgi:hypothetical protein
MSDKPIQIPTWGADEPGMWLALKRDKARSVTTDELLRRLMDPTSYTPRGSEGDGDDAHDE